MITYLCHDLEIDVKGFSHLFDNDKGGDRLLAQFKNKAKITLLKREEIDILNITENC